MYLRLVFQGTIGAAEEFTAGASYTLDIPNAVWDQPSAEAIVTAILAIPTPTDLLKTFPSGVALTGVRLEGHEDTGRTLGAAEGSFTARRTGTGTGASHPPQTAIVLSMKSAAPGQSGRGRLYWPAMTVSLDTNYFVDSPSTTALVTAFRTYLSAIGSAIRDNAGLFPWTTVSLAVASTTKGTQAPVTRLEIGNVLDTQRRRRNKLVETKVALPYPPE